LVISNFMNLLMRRKVGERREGEGKREKKL
jgi:hypothetical protein